MRMDLITQSCCRNPPLPAVQMSCYKLGIKQTARQNPLLNSTEMQYFYARNASAIKSECKGRLQVADCLVSKRLLHLQFCKMTCLMCCVTKK